MTQRSPLGKGRLVAEQQVSALSFREGENFRPSMLHPFLACLRVEVIRNKAGFLIGKAHTFQQLADVVYRIEDTEALMDQILDHRAAPAVTDQTRLSRPRFDESRQLLALCFAEFSGTPWRFFGLQALDTVEQKSLHPPANRLCGYRKNRCHLTHAFVAADSQD